MLDQETKRRIDTARDILVGKLPNPQSQVEQITIAMIYKFMDDMDAQAEDFAVFFQHDDAGLAVLDDRGQVQVQAEVDDRHHLAAQVHDAEHGRAGAAQAQQRYWQHHFLHLQ